MSRISKIFNSNSDSDVSDYSDIEENSNDEQDDLDDLEDLDELDDQDGLDDQDEQDDIRDFEEDEKNNDDTREDEDNEDEKEDDDDESDSEEDKNTEEEIEYDDYDDFEENGLLLENDDYTDSKVLQLHKKSKTIKNIIELASFKEKKREIQLENIRAPSIQLLEKLLKNKTNAERLERSVYNHIIRDYKSKNIKLTLNSKEFRQSYSRQIYSIMSLMKSLSFLQVKACFDNDVEYFSRGSFKNEKIQDEKRLRLITHVQVIIHFLQNRHNRRTLFLLPYSYLPPLS